MLSVKMLGLALVAVLAVGVLAAPSASAGTFEVSTKAKKGTIEGVAGATSLVTENGTILKCGESSVSGNLKEGTGVPVRNEIGSITMATWNKGTETCEGPLATKFGVVTETLTKPWALIVHELLKGRDLVDGLLHTSLIHLTGGCSLLVEPGLVPTIYHNQSQLLLFSHAANLLAKSAGWGEDTLKITNVGGGCFGVIHNGESAELTSSYQSAPTGADVLVRGGESLPNKTTISGFGGTIEGTEEVPVINWAKETPITTHGCKGGKVTTITEAVNTETGKEESRESTLTEKPTGSEEFTGNIPVMSPLHGKAKLKIKVSGCEHSSENTVIIIIIYIDPSGEVVDGNHSNAAVAEATVTLLASESKTEAGPFAAVPNGSEVMSPMNRINPDLTRENGSFGWETIEGYYKVEATKGGCGTATTSVFHVPPPQEKLLIVLHC